VNIRKRVSAQTIDSPLVFGYETAGNQNIFLGLTYQNFYGTAHPDSNIAQAAQAVQNVPTAVPMATAFVPQGEGAAAESANIPKTDGAPPGGLKHEEPDNPAGSAASPAGSPSAPAPPSGASSPAANAQSQLPRGVAVTCPPGGAPGQRISFRTPDGTNLSAQIPEGVAEGQTFIVHY